MDSPLRVVELFAGIGAQATALENLGIPHECIISETDPHAIAMYEAMHGKTENLGDIRLVERLPDCDLATWTFPCQSISIAGHMEGMVEGSGSKSSLGWEAIRLFRDAVERETTEIPPDGERPCDTLEEEQGRVQEDGGCPVRDRLLLDLGNPQSEGLRNPSVPSEVFSPLRLRPRWDSAAEGDSY